MLTEAAIAQHARLAAAVVEETLANLVQDRLVRRLKGEPDTLYELAHEHMIARIRSWVSEQERAAEFARKLLDEQLGRWRKLGEEGLIDLDTLKRIDAQRANPYFTVTAADELEMLLRSALAHSYEVPIWFERAQAAGVPADAIALEGLKSDNFRVRAASVSVLGQVGERFTDDVILMLADLYPQVRVAAIASLGRLRPDGAWRSNLKYECYVPAGEFIMGDDSIDGAKPAHKVSLNAFYMGKYPVTNAEYARFMADRGRSFNMPAGKEQHPVVNVSWYDAKDYAEWAEMRLPTEAQWEKAASWDDKVTRWQGDKVTGKKRKYPWGNTFAKAKCNSPRENPFLIGGALRGNTFDKTKCNTKESGIGGTTPVGKYSPAGDSPCGAADMARNVWDWCSSLYRDYPYRADDGREDLTINDMRVLRGGSWSGLQSFAAAPFRDDFLPDFRGYGCGVRVCAVLPPP